MEKVTDHIDSIETPERRRAPWWRRLTSAVRVARGLFPLTTRGSLTILLATLTLRYFAQPRHDLVASVIALAALALVGLVLFGTIVHALRLAWFRRQLARKITSGQRHIKHPPIVSAHIATALPIQLPKQRWLFLHDLRATSAETSLDADFFNGSNGLQMLVHHRGEWNGYAIRLSSSDAFGLTAIEQSLRVPASLIVDPYLGAMENPWAAQGFALGDDFAHPRGNFEGDRVDVRAYAPGDPARFVHWKAFARSGKLATRQKERSIMWAKRVAFYFWPEGDDEASAALAYQTLRNMPLGTDWSFATPRLHEPTDDLPACLAAIRQTQLSKHDIPSHLAHFQAFLRTITQEPTTLVVFAPESLEHHVEFCNTVTRFAQETQVASLPQAIQIWIGYDTRTQGAEAPPHTTLLRTMGALPLTWVERRYPKREGART